MSSYTIKAITIAVAAPTGSVLAQVFNELGLGLAIMGALGGGLYGLVLGVSFLLTLRGAVIGGLMAFGVGANIPALLPFVMGGSFSITESPTGTGALLSLAFILGFAQDRFIDRFLDRSEKSDGDE